jgi:16S rRNA (cytosine967-C5)-methyltransferase
MSAAFLSVSKSAPSARDLAVGVLARLHQPRQARMGLTAQQALAAALGPEPRPDARLCAELVYGALRQELRLDWLLRRQLRTAAGLPPFAVNVLRIALYEMLHMQNAAPHAVNWAVGRIRDRLGPGMGGLANACLRAIARLGDAVHQPEWYCRQLPERDVRLSVVYGVPLWIVRLWLAAYGEAAAAALARSSAARPHPCLRINRSRQGWRTLRETLIRLGGEPLGPAGLVFAPENWPDNIREYVDQGLVSQQGAGSLRILDALGAPDWTGPLWDACAGYGGKTCALLEAGNPVRLASDPHAGRLAGLRRELVRLGLAPVSIRQGAIETLRPDFAPGTIVLDVPCSALGTLSRRADVRLYRRETDPDACVRAQRSILESAWAVLPGSGRLAYITCTVNPAENEKQIGLFVRERRGARLEAEVLPVPGDFGEDMMYGAVVSKL